MFGYRIAPVTSTLHGTTSAGSPAFRTSAGSRAPETVGVRPGSRESEIGGFQDGNRSGCRLEANTARVEAIADVGWRPWLVGSEDVLGATNSEQMGSELGWSDRPRSTILDPMSDVPYRKWDTT